MSAESCRNCGVVTRPEMKYCPKCGEKLDAAVSIQDEPSQEGTTSQTANSPIPISEKNKSRTVIWAFVGVVLLFLGFGIWGEINSQRLEDQYQALLPVVSTECALKLQPAAPEISGGEFYYDGADIGTSNEKISVKVLDSSGRKTGSYLTCEYSIDRKANVFHVESARWHRVDGGTEFILEYDRESNSILTSIADMPILLDEPTQAPEKTGSRCEQAFRTAASVPLSQDNNAEIRETTFACSDVDEWWSMLNRYPDVFGMTYYLDSEKGLYVGSACLVGSGSPVCNDAERKGLTF